MWMVLLAVLSVATCSELTFDSAEDVERYLSDKYSHLELIGLEKVFQYKSCHSYLLLQTGSITTTSIQQEEDSNVSYSISTLLRESSTSTKYAFAEPAHGTVIAGSIWWSDSSRYTPPVFLNSSDSGISPVFEFTDLTYTVPGYHEHEGVGYFNLTVTWSNPFPAVKKRYLGGPWCSVAFRKAKCNYKNSTTIEVKLLRSVTAITKNTTIKLFLDYQAQCEFVLPSITLNRGHCPRNSKLCKPPCSNPDNVVNVTAKVVNDTSLHISWFPPPAEGDVKAYAIRWGLVKELKGPSTFPLENTQAVMWIRPELSQAEQHCSFDIDRDHIVENYVTGNYVTIQVVALCAEPEQSFGNGSEDLLDVKINDEHISELFVPARYDVDVPYDRRQHPEEGHHSPEENLQFVSPSTNLSGGKLEGRVFNSSVMPAQDSAAGNKMIEVSTAGSKLIEIIVPSTVGGSLAVLVVLIVLLVVVRRQCQQRRTGTEETRHKLFGTMQANPLYHTVYVNLAEADKWEILPTAVEWGEEIGFGAFGSVFKCVLKEEKNDLLRKTVAVKTLTGDCDDLSKQQFIQEIRVMKELEPHPYILQLIGCVTLSSPICLVMEYADNGDLLSYLKQQRIDNMESEVYAEIDTVEQIRLYSKLLTMAVEIADGMEYISSKGYIHRDLAARNLLLDGELTVKIADFGLARYLHTDDVYIVQYSKRLPVKWLSVEALSDLTFSTASDVWAFGVVLYELMSLGDTPYPTIDPTDMLKYLSSGQRMDKPKLCDQTVYAIMMECWQAKPASRPGFAHLRQQLKTLYTSIPVCECGDDSSSIYSSISDGMDEGFVAAFPSGEPSECRSATARSPLSSESSAFSDVNMIISSPVMIHKPWTAAGQQTHIERHQACEPIIVHSTHL